jgi:putative heme-binding domain-containing protein
VLKKQGIYDADKITLVSAVIPALKPPTLSVKEVLALRGDVARGKLVAAACLTCHRVGDEGTDYGPNLTGWAKRQTTEVLAQSIVTPSADIAHGFGGNVIRAKGGVEIHGRVLADSDPLIVVSQGGLTQTVPRSRVEKRDPLPRSLMLSAEEIGLDAQSVADVMAYLRSRAD